MSLISDLNYVMHGRGSKKANYNKVKFELVVCNKAYMCAWEVALPPQPNKCPMCCAVFIYTEIMQVQFKFIMVTSLIDLEKVFTVILFQGPNGERLLEVKKKTKTKTENVFMTQFTTATVTTTTNTTAATNPNTNKAAAAAAAAAAATNEKTTPTTIHTTKTINYNATLPPI